MVMLTNPLTAARKLLMKHEGLRLKVYKDTVGKETIGYGRNLVDRGITEAEAEHLLANDIIYHYKQLTERLPWTKDLDDVRQLALLSMTFNMGIEGVLKFKRMLDALERKDFTQAAISALDSKWRTQVGKRATEIANMLQTGELPNI